MQSRSILWLSCFTLAIALPFAVSASTDDAPRVIVIGVDGFSADCIKDVPTIDWLKANGSWTFRARTVIQAVSAPGWSSNLCSLDPVDTGIINNDWVPQWKGGNPSIHPISGDKPFKCVFETIKTQNPNLITTYNYNWIFLSNFGQSIGYVDHEFFCDGSVLPHDFCDQKVLETTLASIDRLDFNFLFNYFGNLDHTGHTSGFCDKEYAAEMTRIDGYIKQILDKLQEKGVLESTFVILTTDHGATSHTTHHGDPNDQNILIPWIVYGPQIKKGYEITDRVHNLDTSPMVVRLLGLNPDPSWDGRVVPGVFATGAMEI